MSGKANFKYGVKTRPFAIRLPDDLFEILTEIKKKSGFSISQIIVEQLREHFLNEKTDKKNSGVAD